MKWQTNQSKLQRQYAKKDIVRKVKRFLVLPLCLQGERRWLETTIIKQELKESKRNLITGYKLLDPGYQPNKDTYYYEWVDISFEDNRT